MQFVRTAIWIVVTAVLVTFMAMNWVKAPVNIWPLANGNFIHFQWPVGLIALVFFLLGFVPMWLILRGTKWRLRRRIEALENSIRIAVAAEPEPAPQLEAEAEPPAETTAATDKPHVQ